MGMLVSTLVIVMGEFGRTPKLNAVGGRFRSDGRRRREARHGCRRNRRDGRTAGRTRGRAEDILRTVYPLLGIDSDKEYQASGGRPVRILDKGDVIREALA